MRCEKTEPVDDSGRRERITIRLWRDREESIPIVHRSRRRSRPPGGPWRPDAVVQCERLDCYSIALGSPVSL